MILPTEIYEQEKEILRYKIETGNLNEETTVVTRARAPGVTIVTIIWSVSSSSVSLLRFVVT